MTSQHETSGVIGSDIRQSILTRLREIEQEHEIEIILAVESGSRAWGFESTDSDYDVRFIYRHPTEWYFQVLPKRDVVESFAAIVHQEYSRNVRRCGEISSCTFAQTEKLFLPSNSW